VEITVSKRPNNPSWRWLASSSEARRARKDAAASSS
jgi:hypothetical protein